MSKAEKKIPIRKRGRPKSETPIKAVVMAFRVSPDEAEKLRQLAEDTKADNLDAMFRNFITCGLLFLVSESQPENKVFYQRFSRYWDKTKHLKDYSDKLGQSLKNNQSDVDK